MAQLNPLVSIIIPTYNRAALVRRAVESALAQTYSNLEVIVVDDGSTDDTQATLQRYRSSVRLLSQSNQGPAAARNTGIEAARGEIIAFLDSDDAWLKEKITRQVSALEKAGPSVPCCIANTTLCFANGHEVTSFVLSRLQPTCDEGLWTNVQDILATRFLLFNQAVAIRRSVLERVGGFNPKFPPLEDYELALRLSIEGHWAFISTPLTIWYGGSPGSLSSGIEKRRVAELVIGIYEEILARMQARASLNRAQRLLSQELRRSRRGYKAIELGQSESWTLSALGHFAERVERYRSSLYRRTPWYPRMACRSFEDDRATALNSVRTDALNG